MSVALNLPKLTSNQQRLMESPARVLYIGAGTKTGKTVGLALWIIQGLLAGERCAWVGPWFRRTRSSFDLIRAFLGVPIERGDLIAGETLLKITSKSGPGRVDFYSGDNPERSTATPIHGL